MGNCFSIKSEKILNKKINSDYVHKDHDVMFQEYIYSGSSFYKNK